MPWPGAARHGRHEAGEIFSAQRLRAEPIGEPVAVTHAAPDRGTEVKFFVAFVAFVASWR